MKKELLIIAMFVVFTVASCKKSSNQDIAPTPAKTTSAIAVPAGFMWRNSRNINFTVSVSDTRFSAYASVIYIYDANPAAGGKLLAKGSATTVAAFKSTIFISSQVSQVYIIKNAPDNSITTQIIKIGTADITASI